MSYTIESMTGADWEGVRAIYLEGIATGNATFETEAPSWERWDTGHLAEPRLVARDAEGMMGWGALSPISGRCVYAGVAEVSIYVGERSRGRGVGAALLAELVARAEEKGLWTLQAGIFLENEASLALHRRCGFREVGRRERIGRDSREGRWRDVVLMERRSDRIGID